MGVHSKNLKKRPSAKKRYLTLELLEPRQLFAISTGGAPPPETFDPPPTLETTGEGTPPLGQHESPPLLGSPNSPLVYAGADVTVALGDDALLSGEIILNGLSGLNASWSVVSGPGTATVADASATTTSVAFDAIGDYELQLSVSDGSLEVSDRVIITVEAPNWLPSGIKLHLGDEMQFTGNDDHVVVSHDDAYLLNDGSVAFWFKAADVASLQGLFSKDSNGYDTGGHLSLNIENGALHAHLQSTGATVSVSSGALLSADTWHHAVLNFGSAGLELFVDGLSRDSDPYAGGLGTSSGGDGNFEPIVLGAVSWLSGNLQATPVGLPLLGGSINEVLLVDHALSAQEISTLVAGNQTGPAAPVAIDGSESVVQGQALQGVVNATDANGDALTYAVVSSVSHGVLDFNSDGSYTYTPDAGFTGNDSFTFKANDGALDSNTASVALSVQSSNAEEVLATNNPLAVSEGGTGVINSSLLLSTDSDTPASQLTYTISSGPANGTVLLSGAATTSFTQADVDANLVSYQHDGSAGTTDSFAFNVDDGQGTSTAGVFMISVTSETTIPEFAAWQENMLAWGQHHGDALGDYLANEDVGGALAATFYDAIRVFEQIAAYTGDSSWYDYVDDAVTAYRDNYVVPNGGLVSGYWNFTRGLVLHYERTGDVASRDAVVLLSENAAYARDSTPVESTVDHTRSRSTAYSILSYIDAERVGEARRDRLDVLFEHALGHLDQWFIDESDPEYAPFMFSLTADALIEYYKHVDQDPRILEKIEMGANWTWDNAWVAEDESFWYRLHQAQDGGHPTLNLLIAPIYEWLYQETGNLQYRSQADQIFAGGVPAAYLNGAKQFNQNYQKSFSYVSMRQMPTQSQAMSEPLTLATNQTGDSSAQDGATAPNSIALLDLALTDAATETSTEQSSITTETTNPLVHSEPTSTTSPLSDPAVHANLFSDISLDYEADDEHSLLSDFPIGLNYWDDAEWELL